MRDISLYLHIILGASLIILSIMILIESKKKSNWPKPLSVIAAIVSWVLLIPSAVLYLIFYPATKTLVKAGSWPWAHTILMETKEHWGILIPIITTTAMVLIFEGKIKESKKWWILVLIISILIGVMGRIVKMGAIL